MFVNDCTCDVVNVVHVCDVVSVLAPSRATAAVDVAPITVLADLAALNCKTAIEDYQNRKTLIVTMHQPAVAA